MPDIYEVKVKFVDDGSMNDLKQQAKKVFEGSSIKVPITADEKSLKDLEERVKKFSKSDLAKVSLQIDAGTLDKQIQYFEKGKPAKKFASGVAKDFRKLVQDGFTGLELSDLIKTQPEQVSHKTEQVQ